MNPREVKVFIRAINKLYKPVPHMVSLYGWKLSYGKCFAYVPGRSRMDFGGKQCGRKPHYEINDLQFCKKHAEEIDPSLSTMTKVTGIKDGVKRLSEEKIDKFLAEHEEQ